MDKLIELLNEYDKIKGDKEEPIYNWKIAIRTKIYQTYLVSARYSFIKWLVENDKIDIKALIVKGEMRSGWDFDNKKGDEETGEESWNKYFSELCLMLLAIQDKPIDFLISILK